MGKSDFELSMEELRVVVRYAVASTQEVLPLFEQANSEDLRPRFATGAAWEFVHGAARTRLQRVTALDAHRAAKDVGRTAGEHTARAAGDAAAAARIQYAETDAEAAELLGESVRVRRSPELVHSLDDESVASLESVKHAVEIRS